MGRVRAVRTERHMKEEDHDLNIWCEIPRVMETIMNGQYVILLEDKKEKLGRGALSDVFICHKMIGGVPQKELYVIKRVYYQSAIPNMAEQLEREIRVMFEVLGESKYVVKIFDFEKNNEARHMDIVLEYCEGGDLEKFVIAHGCLPEEQIAALLAPVVEVFIKLHDREIIHRDLKLANLLLAKKWDGKASPEIRITDFGLAKEGPDAVTFCGTPVHMASEIWTLPATGYTNKVDVWAFGIMLYRMLFGFYPYEGDTNAIRKATAEGMLRIPKIRFISLECLDLLLKCLRLDFSKRPSFKEIANHPFFMHKGQGQGQGQGQVLDNLFDGYFGYIEVALKREYDFIANPSCLAVPPEPHPFDLHNEAVLAEWAKHPPK